jgi:hypothetical protein
VKQFTRCTNCRQWYTYRFTATVEIFKGRHLPKTTAWCLRCIADAEHRSQDTPARPGGVAIAVAAEAMAADLSRIEPGVPSHFQALVQEHTDLMERAIHEDDTVLVPLIEEFMQRCRASQTPSEPPEHRQRLTSHLQYWEAFLNALNRSHS